MDALLLSEFNELSSGSSGPSTPMAVRVGEESEEGEEGEEGEEEGGSSGGERERKRGLADIGDRKCYGTGMGVRRGKEMGWGRRWEGEAGGKEGGDDRGESALDREAVPIINGDEQEEEDDFCAGISIDDIICESGDEQSDSRASSPTGSPTGSPAGSPAGSPTGSPGRTDFSDSTSRSDSYQSGRKRQAKIASRLKKGWRAVKKGASGSVNVAAASGYWAAYWKGKEKERGMDGEQRRVAWEDAQARLTAVWLNNVLPQWSKKKNTAKVRSLIFRGVPPSVRGRVWMTAVGNPLHISHDLFEILKASAMEGREQFLKESQAMDSADGDIGGDGGRAELIYSRERSAHKAITLDLPRTFPDLTFFHAEGSNYRESLQEILESFVYLRPDIGYSQGMSFLGAILLLYMSPVDSFTCFVNMLLHESCFLHFFRMKMPEVRVYLAVHTRLLAHYLPSLHAHFTLLNVEPELYMVNWVMSLYCHALPLELTSRVWDIIVLDGHVAIFRVALGLLKLFSRRMLAMNFEEVAFLLNHLSRQNIDGDELMKEVRSIQGITRRHFRELYKDEEKKLRAKSPTVNGTPPKKNRSRRRSKLYRPKVA